MRQTSQEADKGTAIDTGSADKETDRSMRHRESKTAVEREREAEEDG